MQQIWKFIGQKTNFPHYSVSYFIIAGFYPSSVEGGVSGVVTVQVSGGAVPEVSQDSPPLSGHHSQSSPDQNQHSLSVTGTGCSKIQGLLKKKFN